MTHSVFGWDLPPGCTMNDIERAFGGDEEEEPVPHAADCKCEDCRPDLLAAEVAEDERLAQEYRQLQAASPEEAPAPAAAEPAQPAQPEYTPEQLAKMREIVLALSRYGIGGLMPLEYVAQARELVRAWDAGQEANELVMRKLTENRQQEQEQDR